MIKRISTFLLLTTLFSFVLGFEIPSPNGFVNDLTNTLTIDQKIQISDLISNIKQTTSAEIAVLIVPTIDGDDVNLLATDIGNKWGIGQKGKNNGIIMLFAMEDRSRSIQVGYGLEGTIPDAIAKRIGENNIVPNFKQGNYFQGIYSAINDIYLYIQKDSTVVEAYKSNNNISTNREKINFELIFFWLVIASIISRSIIPKSKRKDKTKWIITSLIILGAGILIGLIVSNIIIPIIVGYIGMLLGIFGGGGKGGLGGIIGGGGFSGGGGSSFGGFGGGSFGGGGGGGRR